MCAFHWPWTGHFARLSRFFKRLDAQYRRLKNYQYQYWKAKTQPKDFAPVVVIISGNPLVFSRKIITSTGFYQSCPPGASAPVVVKNQSPTVSIVLAVLVGWDLSVFIQIKEAPVRFGYTVTVWGTVRAVPVSVPTVPLQKGFFFGHFLRGSSFQG